MTYNCDKDSKSVSNRIELLKNRNLNFKNPKLFSKYLDYINTYYHLTGYRFSLKRYDAINDDYNGHSDLDLIAYCELDKKLSLLFLKETRRIEEAIRAKLSNICKENDMVSFKLDLNLRKCDLLDNVCNANTSPKPFINISSSAFNNLLKNIYNDLVKIKSERVISHYLNDHNAIIPIWVVVNYISFGTLISLIDCLSSIKLDEFTNNKNYKSAANSYDPCRNDLKSIRMIRNKCSHSAILLSKRSPYLSDKSIVEFGIISICKLIYFFLGEKDIYLRIRDKIENIIKEINYVYDTDIDYGFVFVKNI